MTTHTSKCPHCRQVCAQLCTGGALVDGEPVTRHYCAGCGRAYNLPTNASDLSIVVVRGDEPVREQQEAT